MKTRSSKLKILMPVSLTPKNYALLNFAESSHEHLVPTNYIPIQSYGLLYFTTFSTKPRCHTFASFGNT